MKSTLPCVNGIATVVAFSFTEALALNSPHDFHPRIRKSEALRSETILHLHADGQPTLIFLIDEESATLQINGLTIDRAGLKSLFSSSPNRLEMHRNIFPELSWSGRWRTTGILSWIGAVTELGVAMMIVQVLGWSPKSGKNH
jgi:hypothetical protein